MDMPGNFPNHGQLHPPNCQYLSCSKAASEKFMILLVWDLPFTPYKYMVHLTFSWAFLLSQAQHKTLGVQWQSQVIGRKLKQCGKS